MPMPKHGLSLALSPNPPCAHIHEKKLFMSRKVASAWAGCPRSLMAVDQAPNFVLGDVLKRKSDPRGQLAVHGDLAGVDAAQTLIGLVAIVGFERELEGICAPATLQLDIGLCFTRQFKRRIDAAPDFGEAIPPPSCGRRPGSSLETARACGASASGFPASCNK